MNEDLKRYIQVNAEASQKLFKKNPIKLSEDDKRMILIACFDEEENIRDKISYSPQNIRTDGFDFRLLHCFKQENIGSAMGADIFDWQASYFFEVTLKGTEEKAYVLFGDHPEKFLTHGEIKDKFYNCLGDLITTLVPFRNPLLSRMGIVQFTEPTLRNFKDMLSYGISHHMGSPDKDEKAPFGLRVKGAEIVIMMAPKENNNKEYFFLVRDESNNFYGVKKIISSSYSDYYEECMSRNYISQSRKDGSIPPKVLSELVEAYKDMAKRSSGVTVMVADAWKDRIKLQVKERVETREIKTVDIGFKV
jgi:hypothetical protein